MKVISVNVGLPRTVRWKGKAVSAGIFKTPVSGGIRLRALISTAIARLTRRYMAGRTRRLTFIRRNTTPGGIACEFTAAFNGGRLTSDGGVMLLAAAETG